MKTYLFKELNKDDTAIHIFEVTNFPRRTPSQTYSPHTHDFIEIVYVTDGSALEIVNDAQYEVRRGDLLFINYGSTHQFNVHESFSYINVCFKPEILAETVITPENAFAMLQLTAFDEIRQESDNGMISFSGEERDEIEHLLRSMITEYKQRPDSWRTMLESYMNILFVRILRRVRFHSFEKDEPDVWKQLFDYIDQNLGSDLTLSTLAGKCFYNPSYFSRIFKERFEISVSEYINRRRIDHAIRLFQTTDFSAEHIAELSGFSSKSSFYRIFTKLTGKSPSEYRRQK